MATLKRGGVTVTSQDKIDIRAGLDLGALATVTPGTGVATALGVNVGSAGAPVLLNGAGGTPSSLTLTNATGLPATTGITMSTARLLGRSTAGAGAVEEITLGTNLSFSGMTLNATGDGGGSALVTTAAAVTGSNVTGVVGTLHALDLSGLTAARTFTLPAAAAVDDQVGVVITATHATPGRELLITAASGDTLAGIAGGTEWSRVWQVGEKVLFRCIVADTTWVIDSDGRIPQLGGIAISGSDITSGPAANTWAKVNCNTSLFARGCIVDTSANTIVWRRSSYVSVTGAWAPKAGASFVDNELSGWAVSYDGTPSVGTTVFAFTSNHPGTTARGRPGGGIGAVTTPAGKSLQLNQYANSTADLGARALTSSTHMIVLEIL
jgi:hypothetical protein